MKLKPGSTMPGVGPMSKNPRVTIWDNTPQHVDGWGRPVIKKSWTAHAPLSTSP